MQLIELYIRSGEKYKGEGSFTSSTRLVDNSTDFTSGFFKVGQIIKNLNSGVEGIITAIAPSGNNTLDIDGGAFSGSEQSYQIYDDFTKLDLFKDESVSITDSIQNVKDPAKIFTPFSQQFSVPASKSNNKFFKHYYDSDIENSFDARFQGDGLIQLNGINYKIGKFRLTTVDLKNNVPYSYKLVFTGDTVEFKQILAESDLSSLTFPESLNFEYNSDFVKSKLIGSSVNSGIIFPLITHSKNMRYGYNGNTGYRDAITNTLLNYADLKPAIKVKTIIDAIETSYPEIKFSQQFLNSYVFKSLRLWLHREEGYMSNAEEGGALQTIVSKFHFPSDTDYTFLSGDDLRPARPTYGGAGAFLNMGWVEWQFFLDVTVPDQNLNYTVTFYDVLNNVILQEDSVTGSSSVVLYANPYKFPQVQAQNIDIIITSENTLGISQSLEVRKVYDNASGSQTVLNTGFYNRPSITLDNEIQISRQMPKMKIFDFIKNIFTMFNLTAYKEDGVINVLPLDDYYNAGKIYDITEYVDTEKSKVSKLLQFRNMIFDFKSKKSYLIQYSDELQGNKFAQESYGNNDWDGGDYKVEVDFEKMMYERLSDEGTGDLTTIVQGAMLNKKFEPTIGKPLLFFAANTSTLDVIEFDNSDGTTDNLSTYIRPANGIGNIASGFISNTLNFGVEVDEYTQTLGSPTQTSSNDLFTKYYKNYVANLFDRNARKLNISAYLPLSIILKYRLNDIFVISNTAYRINSIKTNLLTNKSDLELYNLTENVSQRLNGQSLIVPRVQNLQTTGKTSSTINVQFDNITDTNFEKFEIYLDDEYIDFNLQGDVFYGFSGLDSDTTYKISLRAIYDVDGEDAGAFDTDLFETTL
jgi:hypothetical protein